MFAMKERDMGKFNGNGPHYCKNCGATEGIHQFSDDACPNRGEDQTGFKNPIYLNTYFDPQDWENKILEGRTLFDDYFLAAVQGAATTFAQINSNLSDADILELPRTLGDCAYDLAVEAMKKRNEYLSSKEKVNE